MMSPNRFYPLLMVFLFSILSISYSFGQALSSPRQAQEQVIKAELMKAYSNLFSILKTNGIQQMGGLDLDDVLQKLSEVTYHIVEKPLQTQGRVGHRYLKEIKTVFIAADICGYREDGSLDVGSMLLLHESLGAAGFEDQKYQISSAILMAAGLLSNASTSKIEKENVLRSLSQINFTTLKSGTLVDSFKKGTSSARGGVSEAGGGGDPDGASYKMMILTVLLKMGKSPEQVNQFINDFTIETELGAYCPLLPIHFEEMANIQKTKGQVVIHLIKDCLESGNYFDLSYRLVEKNLR